MKDYRREDFLDEYSSSEKEIGELQEISDLLSEMEGAQLSSTFQAELRKKLLAKAAEQKDVEYGNSAERGKFPFMLFANTSHDMKKRRRLLPVFAAAAAVLLVVSVTIFYSGGGVFSLAGVTSSREEPPSDTTVSLFNGDEEETEGDEQERGAELYSPGEERLPGDKNDDEEKGVGVDEDEDEEKDLEAEAEAEADEGGELKEDTKQSEEKTDPEQHTPTREETDEKEDKGDPEHKIWENRKNFRLAGEIKMSPTYYPAQEKDKLEAASEVNYTWEPGKISIATNDSTAFATSSWGVKILSGKGFAVSENEIEVQTFENEEGSYAEILYKARGNPTLIVHYQEENGSITFSYQEKGGVAAPGFYKLLDPAEAIKGVRQLELFAPTEKISLSFQKVSFTYHNFLQEGKDESIKLPAYKFVGMGAHGEVEIYLPAVE